MREGISAIAGVLGDAAAVHGADDRPAGTALRVTASTETFRVYAPPLLPLATATAPAISYRPTLAEPERRVRQKERAKHLTVSSACSPLPP